jgi:hypothetical protein
VLGKVEGASVGVQPAGAWGLAAATFIGAGGGPSACARTTGGLYSRLAPRRCVVVSARHYSMYGDSPWPVLTVKIRQPSHEFTFGVGMSFIPYPLVLTPVV